MPNALKGAALNVADPERLADFYTQVLGMTVLDQSQQLRLGYALGGACIQLTSASPSTIYQHSRTDRYWKIGITLPNVDLAYEQLISQGIDVSAPRQFQDIGYLCHLSDPEGFQIEFLQHTFEGQARTSNGNPSQPLGGGARVSHITLRTINIEEDLARYKDQYGLRLLSIQKVEDFGFTLYFLAATQDAPPHPDLNDVRNRPWLWQRPYPVLELQYITSKEAKITLPSQSGAGFSGLIFEE